VFEWYADEVSKILTKQDTTRLAEILNISKERVEHLKQKTSDYDFTRSVLKTWHQHGLHKNDKVNASFFSICVRLVI
jgi:hypothetical protein